MARRGKSQARHRGNSGSLPGWAWLLIGAILALVVVVAAPRYFKSGERADGFFRPRPNPNAQPAISALDETDPPPRPTPRLLPEPVTESAYDFYTMLPEQETAISDAELAAHIEADTRAPESRPAAPATPAHPAPAPHPDAATPAASSAVVTGGEPSRYLLQAGAFSNPADAESLKAQIALLGLQAKIEAGTIDGKPIHRVRLGPYNSASELAGIKQRLGNGGLSALAIRVE